MNQRPPPAPAGLLGRLVGFLRPPPIRSAAELGAFLDRQAALVAQKSVVGYAILKTRLPLKELMREEPFARAFETARWEGYAAVLADLVAIAEGMLREAAAPRTPDLADRLAALFAARLAAYPVPAHRPDGWGPEIESLRQRLARQQLASPPRIPDSALPSAERIYEVLPIHHSLRVRDRAALIANVQFTIVGLYGEFDRRLERPAVARDLLAEGAPEPA